jgi:hypothetical protein
MKSSEQGNTVVKQVSDKFKLYYLVPAFMSLLWITSLKQWRVCEFLKCIKE